MQLKSWVPQREPHRPRDHQRAHRTREHQRAQGQLEALLVEWYLGRGWQSASNLSRNVYPVPEQILKPGQLQMVWQSRPHRFEIRQAGDHSKQWQFRV